MLRLCFAYMQLLMFCLTIIKLSFKKENNAIRSYYSFTNAFVG
jgi:hypothetical protein